MLREKLSQVKIWFKLHEERILLTAVIILLTIFSFSLGYLIRGEVKKSPIIIESHT